MRALVNVELDPLSDVSIGLSPGFPSVQIDALVFQGPPQLFDKDVDPLPGRFMRRMIPRGEEAPFAVQSRCARLIAAADPSIRTM